jgi:uncharacterized protein (DUF2147 family)
MKYAIRLAIATALLLGTGAVYAANNTPIGTWKTIDDTTHKPKSIVQITETNGEFQAKVLQVLQSDDGPHPICSKCDGSRKNQPVEGMTIMWGVSKNDDEWDGGKILNPHDGKIYKVSLRMLDDGSKLRVHGYIGFSLLGKTQIWERQQ